MKLIDDMRAAAARETSMFAAQLLKEDIRRLEQVDQLAKSSSDFAIFRKQAMALGWTSGDLRTFELNPELGAFLEIVFEIAIRPGGDEPNPDLNAAWDALHKRRMDVLVGCLSRPRLD